MWKSTIDSGGVSPLNGKRQYLVKKLLYGRSYPLYLKSSNSSYEIYDSPVHFPKVVNSRAIEM